MLAMSISDAKTAHSAGKKQTTATSRHVKATSKEAANPKKMASRQKPVTNARHKEHVLASAKNGTTHDKKSHQENSHSGKLHQDKNHQLVSNRHSKSHDKRSHHVITARHGRSHEQKSEVIEQVAETEQQTNDAIETTEAQILASETPVAEHTTHLESHWGKQLTEAINGGTRIHSLLDAHHKNNIIGTSTNTEEVPSHVTSVHAVIDSSLSDAATQAGLNDDLVVQLTEIFAWDIDFATNLRHGDQFTVVYEANGSSGNSNPIIAAQFVNQGRTVTAIRYKDKEGMVNYYSPDGKSMRKTFLSAPVDFARISSHFDPHRRHPILNRIRAHKGVDYAARTGTPVKSAGNGTVAFLGRKGAYGNMLIIEHGEHYETVYAHLSDFKSELSVGDTVKQGDVIGFVGQTGLATGPHLHYEFRIDGVHQNPEKLNAQQSLALDNELWDDFHTKTLPLLVQINKTKSDSMFAKNRYTNSLQD